MHLFSVLTLLLAGHVTATAGQGYRNTEYVCPGQFFPIAKKLPSADLLFKSSVPGSSEKQVANRTHILLPSYQFKGNYIYIPEVMKQHEGEYCWSFPHMFNMELPVINLILKDCSVHSEVTYGEKFSLEVPKNVSILEFTTPKSTDRRVLWSRINADNKRGARGEVTHDRWEAVKITYADEGRYTFLKENGVEISSTILSVTELKRQYDLSDGSIKRKFPVPLAEAVLTFIDSSKDKHVLFQNAMVTEEAFRIFGSRIDLHAEFGELVLTITDLKSGDKGQYEVRDKNKSRAVVMNVYDSSESSNESLLVSNIVSVIGTLLLLLGGCCFVRRCCRSCKKIYAPVASPSPAQPIHIHDPVAMSTPTSSLPPPPVAVASADRPPWFQPYSSLPQHMDSQPPPYSEVAGSCSEPCPPYTPAAPSWASVGGGAVGTAGGAAGEGGGGEGGAGEAGGGTRGGTGAGEVGGGAGADTNPVSRVPLDPGPQYQLQGWGGGLDDFLTSSPLSMDTNTGTSAYNSDKLNF
ncbi:hypothetical protein AALO_G00270510 [Alosa alosa]|uniref:Uncharacterized protein n=2 Tax=Alosa alosa TaxID=278164 RepID=A0AAV6FQB3_9TELE|nr:uncharacterized protein LOC125286294 isoform X1 [Alosa alosa]XP_048087193.1 uncharacterized protein LOC125286294 isoform X1 [Alosa alosa]XP_048087194.1 uncharacterized protein LOC125286294 isoform X1 [Alosa alosa]KAG5263956.1 hypothetical protein AALO_G00270510 [Alosa alosa]